MATPSDWKQLAKNHIPGRDWALIGNVWGAAALTFEPATTSGLSQAIDPIIGPNFSTRSNVSIFEFPGGQVAAFHDAVSALCKCAYVLRTIESCLLDGQPTWASVDAYHFSLLACRALLALLGVHIVHIEDTRCVLDVFPQGDLESIKKAFRKANRGARDPARLIFRNRGSLIEQRQMWAILIRVLRVTELPTVCGADVDAIEKIGDGFGRSRNGMIYGNSEWLYKEDAERPASEMKINDDIHSYQDLEDLFVEQRDANFAFAAALIRLLRVLAIDIREQSGVDLFHTWYGPRLAGFSHFGVAEINVILSNVLRRRRYGAETPVQRRGARADEEKDRAADLR